MALGFEKLTEEERKVFEAKQERFTANKRLFEDFLLSGVDIAKVTGVTSTEAETIYFRLASCANTTMKERGVKVSKRGDTIYLLNTNINRVIEAPEARGTKRITA